MSNAGKRHMAKVAQLPCVLCKHMGLGESPSHVHHLEYGTGAGEKSSDFLTIALCPRHHLVEYPESVHALKEHGLYLRYKLSELDLLAMTLEALA